MYSLTMSPVLTTSSFVKRNESAIDKMAEELAVEDFSLQKVVDEFLPKRGDADLIQFICISTAINFCSTDPITKEKFESRIGKTVYRDSGAIVNLLGYAINHEWPLLDANYLKNVSLRELESVLRGNMRVPLIGERLEILHEIGRKLEKYQGSFSNLFETNGFQAGGCSQFKGIIPTLAEEFPFSFEDIAYWPNGLVGTEPVKIYFRKKAQLACLLCHNHQNSIKGIDVVGPIIDSQVIRPLIEKGALQCAPILTEKMNKKNVFLSSSIEVIELRANAMAFIDLLLVKINERRLKTNPPKPIITHRHLDKKLWDLGHNSTIPQIIVHGREF